MKRAQSVECKKLHNGSMRCVGRICTKRMKALWTAKTLIKALYSEYSNCSVNIKQF